MILVVLLTFLNPAMFSRKSDLSFDRRYFDLAVWGGILVVAGYAMGTLYERNQKTLSGTKNGYDSMLVILQQVTPSPKPSANQPKAPEPESFHPLEGQVSSHVEAVPPFLTGSFNVESPPTSPQSLPSPPPSASRTRLPTPPTPAEDGSRLRTSSSAA